MELQENFIYLKSIDSSIVQRVRYATCDNFVGQKIDGYYSAEIILTRAAAQALQNVQRTVNKAGYNLVIYDGYRPQRAVNHFIDYLQTQDESQKSLYYPTIDKKDLLSLGYIAEKSAHSRGSTVDVSIISINKEIKTIEITERSLLNGSIIQFLDDNTVDMGSSFDLLHPASHHDSMLLDIQYIEMRNFLKKAMNDHGFEAYDKEWWHYSLKNEPYPDRYFDFIIQETNQEL